jgi:hypothetical protein
MDNNVGLALLAGGAALVGFAFISQKDESPKPSVGGNLVREDFETCIEAPGINADGTVMSVNGQRTIPKCASVAALKIQDCDYVNYLDDGEPICGKLGGVQTRFPEPAEPPDKRWWGIYDWLGLPQREGIPPRATSARDSKLYMFEAEPVIESIGITRPGWLVDQDQDPFI